MKPERLYPHPRYYTVMGLSIALVLLTAIFSWTIPVGTLLLAEVMSPAIALVLMVAGHILLLAAALWLGAAYVRRLRYEILEDEVIVHAGIITKSVKHVPFRAITNLKVTRGPVERLFDLGSLHIETAGMSGQNTGAEETLAGLGDVQAVYDLVAAELRRFRSSLAPTQAASEPLAPEDSVEIMAALLDEVRAIRARLEAADERPAR